MAFNSETLLTPSHSGNWFRFLALPGEIREMVYKLLLVAQEPIVFSYDGLHKRVVAIFDAEGPNFEPSGPRTTSNSVAALFSRRSNYPGQVLPPQVRGTADVDDPIRFDLQRSLQDLDFTLTRCGNTQISRESFHIFYSQNTFHFAGSHRYVEVARWLEQIGPDNRRSLANIELEVLRMDENWQNPSGRRVHSWRGNTLRQTFQLNPHFQPQEGGLEGTVDNIHPAIYHMIVLLREPHKPGVVRNLTFILPPETVPGVRIVSRRTVEAEGVWRLLGGERELEPEISKDLPNLVEHLCASNVDQSVQPLDVKWKTIALSREMAMNGPKLEDVGWKIVKAIPTEEVAIWYPYEDQTMGLFELKCSPIVGRPVPTSPSLNNYSARAAHNPLDRVRYSQRYLGIMDAWFFQGEEAALDYPFFNWWTQH
jgi:hypothetical protein